MKKLTVTNELATAYLSGSLTDADSLKSDPQAYIANEYKSNMGHGKELKVVENSGNVVHLGLPYYSGLNQDMSSIAISDDNLDDVAGGEIWITITVLSQEKPELIGLPEKEPK